MKKEIKEDIKHIKKNIFLVFKYYIHLVLYYGIVAIGLLILIYYLDEKFVLNTGSIIVVSLIYMLLMCFVDTNYIRGKFKNICTEDCIANIVHDITLSNNDNPVWDISHREVKQIKYKYKNKTYNRIVMVWDDEPIKYKNKKIDIKVCKFFPKLIYIVRQRNEIIN